MTVIAWDGKTLAADKRAVSQGLVRTTTKIFRIDGALYGICGDADQGQEMIQWIRDGADVAKFPASQRDKENWANVVVVDASGVRSYERTPYPVPFEDRQYATGSGRDYALAAMYLGKSAAEAVEVACHFENGCGNGVDVLHLHANLQVA